MRMLRGKLKRLNVGLKEPLPRLCGLQNSTYSQARLEKKSLDKDSCKANSDLHRVQPRLSHETMAKIPLCANSVVDEALLPLSAVSAKKVLSRKVRTKAVISPDDLRREAKNEAPLSASSEAILASLKERTLLRRAKLTFKGRAKIVASPCEANSSSEAIPASLTAKKQLSRLGLGLFSLSRLILSLPESSC